MMLGKDYDQQGPRVPSTLSTNTESAGNWISARATARNASAGPPQLRIIVTPARRAFCMLSFARQRFVAVIGRIKEGGKIFGRAGEVVQLAKRAEESRRAACRRPLTSVRALLPFLAEKQNG